MHATSTIYSSMHGTNQKDTVVCWFLNPVGLEQLRFTWPFQDTARCCTILRSIMLSTNVTTVQTIICVSLYCCTSLLQRAKVPGTKIVIVNSAANLVVIRFNLQLEIVNHNALESRKPHAQRAPA